MDLDKKIQDISIGEQQRVEILKVLYRGAEILILDEPTAVLTDEEAEGLFSMIQRLVSEDKTVVFISHKMKEIMKISDRITILRAGEVVATVNKEDTDPSALASMMVGHEFHGSAFDRRPSHGEVMLSLEHVDYNKDMKHSGLNDVSLKIQKGEVLGIAGVDGNGQSQLAQLVTGLIKPDQGEVVLNAEVVSTFGAHEFIEDQWPTSRRIGTKWGWWDMKISENPDQAG